MDVAAEKNSTLVMPFPVELLRFFENATKTVVAATEPPAEPVTNGHQPVLTAPPDPA